MDGANLPLVHNKVSEMLSFRRAINLASVMDAAIYFVHTSAREGVEAVAEARGHGLPIYAETLHHYTCFTADDYRSPRGFCYHTYPSLKYPEDQAADRKSTRLNSSHSQISYAVFCLKKKQ